MNQAHFYFIIRRVQANLNEANWVTVVELVKTIVGVENHEGQPAYHLHWRGNLDTFEVDNGDPDIPNAVYSNEYIFEARFAPNAVDFDAFKNKLVNAFGVDPEDVTYTTGQQTLQDRPSVFGTYKYNAVNRMIVGLFGWADEDSPPTWEESRVETIAYLKAHIGNWG
jgi:hypothetical protein